MIAFARQPDEPHRPTPNDDAATPAPASAVDPMVGESAESAAIGHLLVDDVGFQRLMPHLRSDDFETQAARVAFEICVAIRDAGGPFTPMRFLEPWTSGNRSKEFPNAMRRFGDAAAAISLDRAAVAVLRQSARRAAHAIAVTLGNAAFSDQDLLGQLFETHEKTGEVMRRLCRMIQEFF